MSIKTTVESTFGFHTRNTVPGPYEFNGSKNLEKLASADAIFLNCFQILGYIPVLGLIPCAIRLIGAQKDPSEPPEVKTAHAVRGVFEGLGLGILYLIPDLFVTAQRFNPSTYQGRITFYNPHTHTFETVIGNNIRQVCEARQIPL